jgi:hypothetical protein
MWKLYEYICVAKYFHKNIHILVFNKYFYKNNKSKLYFEDRVVVRIEMTCFMGMEGVYT